MIPTLLRIFSLSFGRECTSYYDCLNLWDSERKVYFVLDVVSMHGEGWNRYNGDISDWGGEEIAHGITWTNRLTKKCFQSLDIKRTKRRGKWEKYPRRKRLYAAHRKAGINRFSENLDCLLSLISVLLLILNHLQPDEESMIKNTTGNPLVASLFSEN